MADQYIYVCMDKRRLAAGIKRIGRSEDHENRRGIYCAGKLHHVRELFRRSHIRDRRRPQRAGHYADHNERRHKQPVYYVPDAALL